MKFLKCSFKVFCLLPPIILLSFLFLAQATGFSFEHILAIILMFAGSILIIFNSWIGGIVGSLPIIYFLILEMQNPSWLDPTPYLLLLIGYYLLCGTIAYKTRKKN